MNFLTHRIRFYTVYDIQMQVQSFNLPNINQIASTIPSSQNPNERYSHPIISDKGTFFYKNNEIFGSFIDRSRIISIGNIVHPQIFLTFVH